MRIDSHPILNLEFLNISTGAPSNAIPTILTFLPNLQSLDTEYLVSGPSNARFAPNRDKMATLRHLTVRTSSIDIMGPVKLWAWIQTILPRPGLETFKLHAFTLHMGHTQIPRAFILELAAMQSGTLKHFIAGDAELTLSDVECLCHKFPKLETLVCLVVAPDVVCSIGYVVREQSWINLVHRPRSPLWLKRRST